MIKILKQGWYIENDTVEEINKKGEHITIIDLGEKNIKDIEYVGCIRGTTARGFIKFKNTPKNYFLNDKENFSFNVMYNSLYLSASYDVISLNKIAIKIDLSWYTLSYSYDLVGDQYQKNSLKNYQILKILEFNENNFKNWLNNNNFYEISNTKTYCKPYSEEIYTFESLKLKYLRHLRSTNIVLN